MWTKEARIQHAPRKGRYPSDVTDAEWAIIAPMIPPQRPGGRHRETEMRDVMNAVRYPLHRIRDDGRAEAARRCSGDWLLEENPSMCPIPRTRTLQCAWDAQEIASFYVSQCVTTPIFPVKVSHQQVACSVG